LRERARALGWAEERIVVIDQRGHREGDGWGSGRQNR
jgi:hypothetical protein